ncbi:hypothetical protein BD289DRAFT_453369 [Coniella lustricola]|uniref:Uncharacterized protein n=1 Tax=Coniella lustricola TaxID=2025994 RepID=A0A2T3A7M9_9PEZI|nr:hypothetical protein BD289DRAFT_453369 [Coniella lustricola]
MTQEVPRGLAAAYRSVAAKQLSKAIISTPWTQKPGLRTALKRLPPLTHGEQLQQLGRARDKQAAAGSAAASNLARATAETAAEPIAEPVNNKPVFVNIHFPIVDPEEEEGLSARQLAPPAPAGLRGVNQPLGPTLGERISRLEGPPDRIDDDEQRPRRGSRLRYSKRAGASQLFYPVRAEPLRNPQLLQLGEQPPPLIVHRELPPLSLCEHTILILSRDLGRYAKRFEILYMEMQSATDEYIDASMQGPDAVFLTPRRLPDQSSQIFFLKGLRHGFILMEYRAFVVVVKQLIVDATKVFATHGYLDLMQELRQARKAVGLPALHTHPNLPKPPDVFATLQRTAKVLNNHLKAVEAGSTKQKVDLSVEYWRRKAQGMARLATETLKLYRLSIELRMAEIALQRQRWAREYPLLEVAMQNLLESDMPDRVIVQDKTNVFLEVPDGEDVFEGLSIDKWQQQHMGDIIQADTA